MTYDVGTDKRIVRHPPPPPVPVRGPAPAGLRVAVIGGGIAGLAAATALGGIGLATDAQAQRQPPGRMQNSSSSLPTTSATAR